MSTNQTIHIMRSEISLDVFEIKDIILELSKLPLSLKKNKIDSLQKFTAKNLFRTSSIDTKMNKCCVGAVHYWFMLTNFIIITLLLPP